MTNQEKIQALTDKIEAGWADFHKKADELNELEDKLYEMEAEREELEADENDED